MFLVSILALAVIAEKPISAKPAKTEATLNSREKAAVVSKLDEHAPTPATSAGGEGTRRLDSKDHRPGTRDSDRVYRLAALGLLVNTLYLFATVGILVAALAANKSGRIRHEQTLAIVQQQLAITRDSNDISRGAHVTANRAIIDIGPLGDPGAPPITLDDGEIHTIPIEFKNIGRFPAVNV